MLDKPLALVYELQGEKSFFGIEKREEDFITFPNGEGGDILFFYPFKVSFVAVIVDFSVVFCSREKVHILRAVFVRNKGDDTAVFKVADGNTALLANLTARTIKGGFSRLEFSADAYPLVVI